MGGTKLRRLVVHRNTFTLEYQRMTLDSNATNPTAEGVCGRKLTCQTTVVRARSVPRYRA
jgi:hypothetical protein